MEMKGKAGRRSSKYSDDRLKFLAAARRDSEPVKQEPAETPEQPPAPPPSCVADTTAQNPELPGRYEKELLLEELRKGREERYELLRLLSNVSVQQTVASTESATHSFFRSMADVVAQFPPHRIAEVRVRVCSLVSDAELQIMSECSPAEQLEISLHTLHASSASPAPSAPLAPAQRGKNDTSGPDRKR